MGNIWFTSDLHFGHDKEFIWKARGYESVQHMNEEQLRKYHSCVKSGDTVYILGDSIMGDAAIGEAWFSQLEGNIIVILGNHDSNKRIEIYKKYAKEVVYATVVKFGKKIFYLSHYPTLVANYDDVGTHAMTNLFGHTHQTENFYENNPYMYHVGVDSHDGYPVSLDEIVQDIKNKKEEIRNNDNQTAEL